MVAVVFVLGLFVEIMDTTIVNVAIPTLSAEFDSSRASMEWVVLGYLLSLAIWIPASGWIGDRIGTKKTFLFALATFTIASMLCGQAQSLSELIFFRILQGVGGGMLTPVGTAMLFRVFPPQERARASTILIVPTVIAPALGPIVGGLLIDHLSWRWIFYVNFPIGLIGFLFGLFLLKESKEPTVGKFDLPGFILSASGFAGVLYALSLAPEKGWGSNMVLITGLGGLVLLAALGWVETHSNHPMLLLRLYRERMFRTSNFINTLAYGSFASFLFIFPQMVQQMLGQSALSSGLTSLPQAIGMIAMSQVVGKLYHSVGPRRLVIFGLSMVTLSNIPFSFLSLETNLWSIRGLMLLRGMAMAFSFVPLQAVTYANISPSDTGRASAIFSTQRQLSAALGVAILSTVFISRFNHLSTDGTAPLAAMLGGYRLTFAVAALLSCLGAILAACTLRDADAAATMHVRD